ncbi:hypothetical protein AERO9A_340280 [Aeromonas salmonicida]|nr:hypothetical protein AERO9A_340280 [Aeromonas salmonicida]
MERMSKMIAEHCFAIGGCDASQPQQPGSGYELVSQIAKSPDNKVVWAFLNMAEEVPAAIKSNQLHANPTRHLLSVS